jgi:two-component system sensor histidine kinase BaeS
MARLRRRSAPRHTARSRSTAEPRDVGPRDGEPRDGEPRNTERAHGTAQPGDTERDGPRRTPLRAARHEARDTARRGARSTSRREAPERSIPRPPRPPRRTALRHSLRARLLASSVLVAVCSITATAWLAVQGTSESLSVEQGQTLASDTRIHDELVGYAASHPSWEGVDTTVQALAAQTGRRIALATENRRLIADSGAASEAPLPPRASSVVDPLAVDVTLVPEGVDRIDPRAVGPFALPPDERARLLELAQEGASCLDDLYAVSAEVEVEPSGRPSVTAPDSTSEMWFDCRLDALDEPTGSERTALDALAALAEPCLDPTGMAVEFRMDGTAGVPVAVPAGTGSSLAPPSVPPADDARAPRDADAPSPPVEGNGSGAPPPAEPDQDRPVDGGEAFEEERALEEEQADRAQQEEQWAPPSATPAEQSEESQTPSPAPEPWADPVSPELDQRSADCVDSARRELLDPHVAPAALLFIDDPAEDPAAGLALSREGVLRVSSVVLLVLVLTVGVSVTVSTRLARPVRALTDAVVRMRAGQGAGRVEVRDSGELGQLAAAFNEMSEHLERLEEQRRAMVSDVSHELRTPLSNLRGWLEAAQDGVADLHPERMEMLVGETLLLQAIIDDLQDLALADAGKLRLSPEPVEAAALVEQVVASHRLRAHEAGLRLTAEADEVVLRADRTRLAQAVGNLVGNALRHTTAPGSVTVRARREGQEAVIEVADTGAGIAPEDLPQVFDRFWRAEKSRNRQTGGSGLGLAIVRNLAELHGGSVAVESTLGVGSTFTLRLPLSGPARRPTP